MQCTEILPPVVLSCPCNSPQIVVGHAPPTQHPVMLEWATRRVFYCFRSFEALFDRLTGRAGPFFVLFCTALLSLGVLTYFDAFYPRLFWSQGCSWTTTTMGTLWSVYLITGFAFHYYKSVTVLPGSPADPPGTIRTRPFLVNPFGSSARQRRRLEEQHVPPSTTLHRYNTLANTDRQNEGVASSSRSDRTAWLHSPGAGDSDMTQRRTCSKCPLVFQEDSGNEEGIKPLKPERTHHCSVCKTCWLKFDHHCPWINGCVGLYNERHFLLFMVYMSLACTSVALLGFPTMLSALSFSEEWTCLTPRAFTLLVWILSVAMAFAVGIMAIWQIWLVSRGETTVESNDNAYYRKLAKQRAKTFVNPYDLGWRRNLGTFFSVPRQGSTARGGGGLVGTMITILLLSINSDRPHSDGFTWSKRPAWEESRVVEEWEELTDEED